MTSQNELYRSQGRCYTCGGRKDGHQIRCRKCREIESLRQRERNKKLRDEQVGLSEAGKALDPNRKRWWHDFEGIEYAD